MAVSNLKKVMFFFLKFQVAKLSLRTVVMYMSMALNPCITRLNGQVFLERSDCDVNSAIPVVGRVTHVGCYLVHGQRELLFLSLSGSFLPDYN